MHGGRWKGLFRGGMLAHHPKPRDAMAGLWCAVPMLRRRSLCALQALALCISSDSQRPTACRVTPTAARDVGDPGPSARSGPWGGILGSHLGSHPVCLAPSTAYFTVFACF